MQSMAAPDRTPFNTRLVRTVCQRQGWQFLDLDGGEGYLFAVEAGGRRVHCGSGAICAYPGNSATAYTIARDKAFTAAMLAEAGLPNLPTSLYFLETTRRHLRAPGRERADLELWGATASYPVFAKPNRGAHGDLAEQIRDHDGLLDYLDRAARAYDQVVVQPYVEAAEFRILVVAGEARFQYQKVSGGLVGDGQSSWRELLESLNRNLQDNALSPVTGTDFAAGLDARGQGADDISEAGVSVLLPGRGSGATGGQAVGFTTGVDPDLSGLAVGATKVLGLDVAGVDLLRPAPGAPVVLEVNANPSFASLESIGEHAVAEALWTDILARALAAAP